MPSIVDKSSVTKVCVDDFALRKRYSYGTVMVNLDTHRIIDIIDTQETKQVEEWLKTYPNLEIISRDGAMAYSSAARNAHPLAIQVSDRFHLLKNLSDAVEKYMYRLYPSRLVIPATVINPELQALYDTRNRAERIAFAHNKRSEGYSLNDIALLLHSATTTVQKYLAIPADKIPEIKENARERQHVQQMKNKQAAMDEVRKLYAEGYAIDEITRLTGHTTSTVTKYLDLNCPLSNGHYDQLMPGKLAPYELDVIEMRSKGFPTRKSMNIYVKKGTTAQLPHCGCSCKRKGHIKEIFFKQHSQQL